MKMRSLNNEKRLLENTSDELMKKYGEQKKEVGRTVRKLLKSVATRFVSIAMCIEQNNSKIVFRRDIRS